MKSIQLKCLLIFTCLFLTLSSGCDNDSDKTPKIEDKTLQVKNLSFDGCKKLKNSLDDNKEKIVFQVIDDNYLEIQHINGMFNCCPEEIIVNAKIEDGKIIYDECEKSMLCNCICPFDVICNIGPLEYSKYTIEVNYCGSKIDEFTIDFNQKTCEEFLISRK